MQSVKVNKVIVLSALLISSILGILFLSSCSDMFAWYMPDDSDIFLTIGKYWASGDCIPYIDLFDHKGPFIFLISAIGFLIGNGCKWGVMIIEICFLFVSEYFAYKILLFQYNEKSSIILSALIPVIFIYNFVPGNFTEEYMLPFMFISFYLYLKWMNSDKDYHNPYYALFYGVSFGFALMTRVTNSLSICIIVLLILIKLIINKQWKNILYNALCFLVGVLIMVVPFCVYFASKGALYDMWYATLFYNFDYTSNSGLTFEYTLKDFVLLIRMTFPGVLAVLVCLLNVIIRKNRVSLMWLVTAIPSTTFMFMLDRFANYSLILLPFLYISFLEIHDLFDNSRQRKLIIILIILLLTASSVVKVSKMYRLNNRNNKLEKEKYSTLLKEIPEDELNNHFVALDPFVDFYLEEDIKPCCKYFIFQNWQSSNSDKLANLEIEEFSNNNNIHYILVEGSGKLFSDILEEKYVLIDSVNNYNLYKRN